MAESDLDSLRDEVRRLRVHLQNAESEVHRLRAARRAIPSRDLFHEHYPKVVVAALLALLVLPWLVWAVRC